MSRSKLLSKYNVRRHSWHFLGWENTVVLITGASGGVGRAVAQTLASKGAKIGLIARSQSHLDEVFKEINHQGCIAVANVGNFAELSQAVETVASQLGPIEIVINCAGMGAFGSFKNADIHIFEEVMQTNYFGTVNTMRAVLPMMLHTQRGCIINVASIAGRIGVPFEAAYSASKFAVIGLSEAVQCELKSQGIQVSVIIPGPIDTNYFTARGYPYPFKIPAPMVRHKVVDAIIATIENNTAERFIPRWLGWAYLVRILFPALYRTRMNQMYASFLKADNVQQDVDI